MKIEPYKLDRTAFEILSFDEADKKIQQSPCLDQQERVKQFNYLMSVAYKFVGGEWPKMDKTVFEIRKRD